MAAFNSLEKDQKAQSKEALIPATRESSCEIPIPGQLSEEENKSMSRIQISDVKCFVVVHHSSLLMYGALLESGLWLLCLIAELYYFLPIGLLPLTGYFAGKNIDRKLAGVYMFYLALQWLLRIVLMTQVSSLAFQTSEVVAFLIDCMLFRATWTYLRLLRHVSIQERESILIWWALKGKHKDRVPDQISIGEAVVSHI